MDGLQATVNDPISLADDPVPKVFIAILWINDLALITELAKPIDRDTQIVRETDAHQKDEGRLILVRARILRDHFNLRSKLAERKKRPILLDGRKGV